MRTFGQILLEMSFEAKIARRKIEDVQIEIAQHLTYVYLGKLSNNENTEHWKEEVLTWLMKISDITLKPGMRKFSYETYYYILYEEPDNGIDNWESQIKRYMKYKQIHLELNDAQIAFMYYQLRDFYKELCGELAVPYKQNLFGREIFDNLIQKYFII